MTDKLIFRKKTTSPCKYPTIRVNEQTYTMLAGISNTTGMSISAVANKMLEFASEHTEFVSSCPVISVPPCFSCSDET